MKKIFNETFVIVYLNTDTGEYALIPTIRGEEDYVLTVLAQIGPKQKLKNLFKINYLGQVTPFNELAPQLGPKLRQKVKELTGK
jgi:hypothetical protein